MKNKSRFIIPFTNANIVSILLQSNEEYVNFLSENDVLNSEETPNGKSHPTDQKQ